MSIMNVAKQHRSIRSYKSDPVPEEILNDCLETGIRASSSGNMESYSIIVTRDRALRERLYKPHYEQKMVLEAPLLLAFCADFHRMRLWLKQSAAPDNFDNFMSRGWCTARRIGTSIGAASKKYIASARRRGGIAT